MKLLSSPASPFGCKTKLVRHLTGLEDAVAIEYVDTVAMNQAGRHPNPLGKIPCLMSDSGDALFDSFVICDKFARLSNSQWLIPDDRRDQVLVNHALATGATEAALLVVYEHRLRSEDQVSADWIAMQTTKIEQALVEFEKRVESVDHQPTLDQIALASLLGYLDLRFHGKWREAHPVLVEWLAQFIVHVPAFEHLKPH